MMPVLRTARLAKHFGTHVLLADVDLDVFPGECVGVHGAPGSGLTTLLKVLATLLPPTSGLLLIDGIDAVVRPDAARQKMAFIGAAPAALPGLDAREYLRFITSMRGGRELPESEVAESLARVGISRRAMVEGLPRGVQRRLAFEAAFLSGADLVLFDAAGGSGDATGRRGLLDWIGAATSAERAVVAVLDSSTDLRAACTRVLHLHDGRLFPDGAARPPAAQPHGVAG